jgi:sugar/nucleoside kinase (ribokinase family)
MSFDVFSMCNALYDIQAEVPDEILAELALDKGSMILLSEEQQAAIVPRVYTHIVHTEAGGSGANTAFGVALLGGTACYTSRVGDDEHANLYRSGLGERGVKPNLGTGTGATGVSLILVTPDAQRTMCTYLGRSRELTADDVNLSDLRDSKYLYVTAYLWDTDNQKAAVVRAMEEANAAGVKVALSLSDPFCVHRHREELLQLIQRHVNLLFGNYSEAEALTGTDSPEEALRVLSQYSDIAVVTLDEKGSLIRRGEEVVAVPVYPVKAVDTTGAGDMFAAGLLYGLTQGYSLEVTGRIASYAAAQVVAKMGPRLEAIDQEALAQLRAGAELSAV